MAAPRVDPAEAARQRQQDLVNEILWDHAMATSEAWPWIKNTAAWQHSHEGMLQGMAAISAGAFYGSEGGEALESAAAAEEESAGASETWEGPPYDAVTIRGIRYGGHALEQMEARKLTPSIVEEAVSYGRVKGGNTEGTLLYYDDKNNVSAAPNWRTQTVVNAYKGKKGRW